MRTSSEVQREDHFQLLREAILGGNRSMIVECVFSPRQRRSGKPTAVDIFAAGRHIGVVWSSVDQRTKEMVQMINDGCRYGMARLEWWPNSIGLDVCPADFHGRLRWRTDRFLWRDERRAA